ncbi:MAG TPA: hypothetical protein VLG11_00535 [Candidatus Saccharimonadales bacterium]|nr:hypothetical protein [Candidatus Saccharimonadales bacterium]
MSSIHGIPEAATPERSHDVSLSNCHIRAMFIRPEQGKAIRRPLLPEQNPYYHLIVRPTPGRDKNIPFIHLTQERLENRWVVRGDLGRVASYRLAQSPNGTVNAAVKLPELVSDEDIRVIHGFIDGIDSDRQGKSPIGELSISTNDDSFDARVVDLAWKQNRVPRKRIQTLPEPLAHIQRLAEYTVAASVGLLAIQDIEVA